MSAVRSIRLSKEIDTILSNEAKERGLSYNQLVASILKKYSDWDRFTEKLGYVSNSAILYKRLVDLIPDEKVEEFGSASAKMVKDALLVLYKKADTDTFLRYMSLVTKYSWGSSVRYDQKTEGNSVILTVHHVFGQKWSLGFRSLMHDAVRDILGVEPNIVSTENTLTIAFPIQTKRLSAATTD